MIAGSFLLVSLLGKAQLDVNDLTGQILEKLVPALNLTADQKPTVGDALIDFLTKKSAILPLMKSDPASYASKFNQLNGGFISKLKAVLLARQMTTYLSLKPKITDTTNPLVHLFY